MSKKERTLTIYFDSEDPIYNKLMEMNKFSRAEYIRTALREAVSKGMMMTVSADGINVIYNKNFTFYHGKLNAQHTKQLLSMAFFEEWNTKINNNF